NRKLIAEVEEHEHKSRRQDVLVDEHTLFAFYDARIPAGIHNGAALHLYDDPARALSEVCRVLAPGGIYVGSTIVWTTSILQPVMRLAGTKVWRTAELRRLIADAGLVGYEEARLRGAMLLRARRP
ncbi:MAG: DUF3418 domain-containing protein, partial [Deltaproteobacteria bacterium]|nr:DUF3418 domain-containing protein [Deltaproteobacteria bacterium]